MTATTTYTEAQIAEARDQYAGFRGFVGRVVGRAVFSRHGVQSAARWCLPRGM